jgi:hypothetical protein
MQRDQFLYSKIVIPNWFAIQRELRGILAFRSPRAVYSITRGDHYRSSFPGLFKWFDSRDLRVTTVADMRVEGQHPAHVDIWDGVLALNLPVDLCDHSITRFYTSKVPGEPVSSITIPHLSWGPEDLEEIDRYALTGPVITNTQRIHSVCSGVGEVRRSLSFRFDRAPWELVGL